MNDIPDWVDHCTYGANEVVVQRACICGTKIEGNMMHCEDCYDQLERERELLRDIEGEQERHRRRNNGSS